MDTTLNILASIPLSVHCASGIQSLCVIPSVTKFSGDPSRFYNHSIKSGPGLQLAWRAKATRRHHQNGHEAKRYGLELMMRTVILHIEKTVIHIFNLGTMI
ncbi:hypothetical protein AVEN_64586-1 [Araneus ventricosus]|uniref:Uncharacterized protein n=1 Tax=Araneus ventricosus TaxID=182803 RepID=A0A4Y2QN07_ARAVE|nr:hypothetical protein AVEN_64586-1 [Araneus ventricosus]